MDIAQTVMKYITEHGVICIAGFSYGSRGAADSVPYGIGWILRSKPLQAGFSYLEVPPSLIKTFPNLFYRPAFFYEFFA